jgi:hypothetical protein
MTSEARATTMSGRIAGAVVGRLRDVRALPVWSAAVRAERRVERVGGHRADAATLPHLGAAIDWLCRAQDATGGRGIARGYGLTWSAYFRARGWQPAYPETTGYIIPTLIYAARRLDRPELLERARRAAEWEIELQFDSGAVQGGVVGQERAPAVFNTGQVIFGWLAAAEELSEPAFLEAARRAAGYLAPLMESPDLESVGRTRFARADSTLYNARTAWALAEVGARLGEERFLRAAGTYLGRVGARQAPNGWLPACCLYDPERPLLHTVAYAVRGLLEGGRVLGNDALVERAALAARALAGTVRPDGRMPGKLDAGWRAAADWSCLTGQAQTASIWLRLHETTGDTRWLEPVGPVLRFLKSTQNLTTADPGLRGGIRGSDPIGGEYGRYEVLSWATKFFADALMRHERATSPGGGAAVGALA